MKTEHYGWAGALLRINLTNSTSTVSSTIDYASRFIGGRGLASRFYWDEMEDSTDAFSPNNQLYFMNGPLSGTRVPASSRWIVLGKSPMTKPEQYASGNLGGTFGAAMKWAGLDGLVVTGASKKPAILVVEPGQKFSIESASELWGKDTTETIDLLEKSYGSDTHVATIGRAGEVRVRFANIVASGGAVATKGFGAVMGSKNLKAIVIRAPQRKIVEAHPEEVTRLRRDITKLWKGDSSSRFWSPLMLEDTEQLKNQPCSGCPGICRRAMYQTNDGQTGHRKMCMASLFYYDFETEKYGKMGEVTFRATEIANRYGMCAIELRFLLLWLPKAIKRGLIDPVESGLQPENMGTREWIENLVNLIADRKGVGDLLAEGSRRSASQLGAEDLLEGLVTKGGFDADFYNPRMFLNNAPIYATEPVYPITQLHRVSFPMLKWMVWFGTEGMMGFLNTEKLRNMAKVFWGDERAAEMDNPEKKGEAAVLNQNRCYAMENMVYCDFFWPIDFTGNTDSGVGDPTLESSLYSAVTGINTDVDEFLKHGERSVNLCRAIYLREGRQGRVDDTLEEFNFIVPLEDQDPPVGLFNPELLVPGKNGEVVSRKGAVVERDDFKKMMDDYYIARGWDLATGFQKKETLEDLKLSDIVSDLRERDLLSE